MTAINTVINGVLGDGDWPDVYTDIDEKPIVLMTHVEQQETIETKQYSCDVCDEVLCHSSGIKEHMLQHKRSRPLHCRRCDQYFVLGESFRAHKQKHELEDSVQCPVCNKRYKSVDGLTTHIKLHEKPEESYECGICCKIFGQPTMLVKHMESHTVAPLYKCDICFERVSTLNDLEFHKKKIHRIYDADIYPYKCTICDLSFKKRSALTDHDWVTHFSSRKMSKVSKKWRSVKYKAPSLNSNDREVSNSHSLPEIKKSMDVCSNVDETQSSNESMNKCETINIHSANIPNDINTNKKLSMGDSKQSSEKRSERMDENEGQDEIDSDFICSAMDKTVVDLKGSAEFCSAFSGSVVDKELHSGARTVLMSDSRTKGSSDASHTMIHTMIPNSIEDDKSKEDKLRGFIDHYVAGVVGYDDTIEYQDCESEETNESKKYKCDLCSLEFEGSDAVERHMLEHNKMLPHYCRRCDLYFVLARNMKSHLIQHEKEEPLMCQLCNEIFNTTEGLDNHSLTHVENYPYKCGVCQRGFQIKSAYHLHMLFHSNTLFQCSECHKEFARNCDLEIHKRKEHFIYDKKFRFGCDLCKMKFKARTPLYDHKRYIHKIQWEQLVSSKGVKHYFRHRRDRSKFI